MSWEGFATKIGSLFGQHFLDPETKPLADASTPGPSCFQTHERNKLLAFSNDFPHSCHKICDQADSRRSGGRRDALAHSLRGAMVNFMGEELS